MYINLIALFYVFWSRTAQTRESNPLLVLFSFLKSQKKKNFEKGYGRKIGFLGSEIFLVWSSVFRIESMRRRWDTLGIMGLHGISGQDYWTEESYRRPTLQGKPGELAGIVHVPLHYLVWFSKWQWGYAYLNLKVWLDVNPSPSSKTILFVSFFLPINQLKYQL